MDLKSIVRKVNQGELHYVLGRFNTVRKTYSSVRRLTAGFTREAASQRTATLFPDADVARIVKTVGEDAVFVGLNLPADTVADIRAFAESEPLHAIYDPNGPTFYYSDVVRGKSSDGRVIPVGGIRDPLRCPAVKTVVDDPVLRAIARGYLGHEPRKILTLLSWSFASGITDENRRQLKHHVIDYHYDIEGYNFVYASFYISDCDRRSGAHVMMKRSHNKKPLSMLLGSVTASEAAVRQQFGLENEIMIEGPAGTGFVQDTSCFHRATPPTQNDRLMLAVRFVN
ncbi:hypothetical protein AB8B21_03395 [Tardiphaga sp. 866_E4_N2_1]|jgi:hypothetical protein|uniref:hypothetical protein n=1 Tax=unclassified Tardiphaga TaxID=2631404 RepID=UPI003F2060B2